MSLKRFIALIAAFAVALAVVATHELGDDNVLGDINGDKYIDVRDLQVLVAKLLLQAKNLSNRSGEASNVLAFQQALTQAEAPGPARTLPPIKNSDKGCFFSYQTACKLQPIALLKTYDYSIRPPSSPSIFERPSRDIIPTVTERYLFRLIPHAPPLAV